MYNDKLSLYGSLYEDPMNQIGQSLQPAWKPSVSEVLVQAKQQENQKKPSNIPAIGSVKQAVQPQIPQNNSTLGYLGGEGNWASALTGMANAFTANKMQKDGENKQLIEQVLQGLAKGAMFL